MHSWGRGLGNRIIRSHSSMVSNCLNQESSSDSLGSNSGSHWDSPCSSTPTLLSRLGSLSSNTGSRASTLGSLGSHWGLLGSSTLSTHSNLGSPSGNLCLPRTALAAWPLPCSNLYYSMHHRSKCALPRLCSVCSFSKNQCES